MGATVDADPRLVLSAQKRRIIPDYSGARSEFAAGTGPYPPLNFILLSRQIEATERQLRSVAFDGEHVGPRGNCFDWIPAFRKLFEEAKDRH